MPFISLSLLDTAVSKISRTFLVPKKLRHLPRVSIVKLLLSYARGEPDDIRAQRLLMPFSEKGHDLVLVWALGRWIVHVLNHELASDLFTDIDRFPKELPPDGLLLWHLIGTSNVVTANGQQWKQQSAIIRGGLNAGIPVDTFVSLSEKVTAILHGSINNPIDFSDIAQRYAIEAVGSAVIGHKFNCLDQDSEFVTAYNGIMKEIASPIYLVFPWLEKVIPRHNLRKRIDQLLGKVSRLLRDKKDNPGKDMMTAMINSSVMTPEIQRNNVITSLIAGHETSAGSLASLAYFLAARPEIQNKARAEAQTLFSSSKDITVDRLKKVPYLDACIKEALRINTPASFVVPRLTTASAMLGNHLIPENTCITANLYAIHHDPRVYRNPHTFDPDRHLSEPETTTKATWLPFSCGPRQCPARTFALFEQRVLILTLLRNFRWSLPSTSRHSSGIVNALSPMAVTIPEDMYLQFEALPKEAEALPKEAEALPKEAEALLEESARDTSVTDAAGLELVLGEMNFADAQNSEKAKSVRIGEKDLGEIRDVVRRKGALNGWLAFTNLLPHHGMHRQLVTDVLRCASAYKQIRSRPAPENTTGISVTVTQDRGDLGLFELGPKSLGGKGWQSNIGYLNLISTWSGNDFAPLDPCTLFIWLGLQKKIIKPEDAEDWAALQMLSTVDYDFDQLEENHGGFRHALNVARQAVKSDDEAVRGACLASMISFDLQREVRVNQQEWCISKDGARNFGPADIPPLEWVEATVADCAGLCPFGYQGAAEYSKGRTGMFLAMMLANTHDVVFDIGSSNRMSSIMYAEAAGVAKMDMHSIFARTLVDQIAHRISDLGDNEVPLYGDSAALVTAAWAPFNGRYRVLERFVKYVRILRDSDHEVSGSVLAMAQQNYCLGNINIQEDDITSMWKKALDTDSLPHCKDRPIYTSFSPPMSWELLLNSPGVPKFILCDVCRLNFETMVDLSPLAVHSGHPLEKEVTESAAVSAAAKLSFMVRWAVSKQCCLECSLQIARWSDKVSYVVLMELMKAETSTNARDWLLQCYAVWCTTSYPISMGSILSGFDLLATFKFDDGAMGHRDVVDC